MITKKDYNNRQAIADDKENFINFAVNTELVNYNEVLDFMEYYQNLNSFEDNLKELLSNKIKEIKELAVNLIKAIDENSFEGQDRERENDTDIFITKRFIADELEELRGKV